MSTRSKSSPVTSAGSTAAVRAPKAKRSVTLDTDLIVALESSGEDNLSSVVNDALRAHLERTRRQSALSLWVDELIDQTGPTDEAEVATFMSLLGGPDEAAR